MLDKVIDEKLEYLTCEVTKFFMFCVTLVDGEKNSMQLYPMELGSKILDFYEKNKNSYNKHQLVNQFIKTYMGIALIKEYSKVKGHLDSLFIRNENGPIDRIFATTEFVKGNHKGF
ncbi:hypothetical protein MHB40_22205 [Lysinibacillus sp. FSL K6-0057]|uniref:hypothetical protein n=1 Tax=Lysinibacillus sp. FSL K6-0057 TaxID=2921411 RepID=UPI00315B07FA